MKQIISGKRAYGDLGYGFVIVHVPHMKAVMLAFVRKTIRFEDKGRRFEFLVLLMFFSIAIPTVHAQWAQKPDVKLTGVLSQDLLYPTASPISGPWIAVQPETLSHKDSLEMFETRSALKAGMFSLLVPGTGQIYNGGTGNYIKAAGFLAVEAAAIAVNIIWNNKGNKQTTFFQNYADAHYSVARYAQWIQNNLPQIEQYIMSQGFSPNVDVANFYASSKELWLNGTGPDPNQPPWTQVNWYALNKVESALGGFFSHNLPPYGTQQYYELIGKYPQFREGWNPNAANDAYNPNVDLYTYLRDSLEVSTDSYYMGQRGLANNLYAVAGTAIGVVIANHFLSALEAAIWAHGHNKWIETRVGVSPVPFPNAGYQTELNVAINF
jgi:hypothetical protein